jgi:hypothetical protein
MLTIYIVIAVFAVVFFYLEIRNIMKGKNRKSHSDVSEGDKTDRMAGETVQAEESPISPIAKNNKISWLLRRFRKEKLPQVEVAEESGGGAKAEGKKSLKKKKRIYAPINAYVYNLITGRCGPAILSGDIVGAILAEHGTLGRTRNEDGTDRYQFDRDVKGYRPTLYPYSPENSANRLYRARLHPEIPYVWSVESLKSFAEKYGIYLLFAGIVIFLMFMYSQGGH